MDLRRLLIATAIAHVPFVQGCLGDCGENDGLRTRPRSTEEALTAVRSVIDQAFCDEVCTSALFPASGSEDALESCRLNVTTVEVECTWSTPTMLRNERVDANQVGPEHFEPVTWSSIASALPVKLQGEMEYGSAGYENCSASLGETLLDQSVTCDFQEECISGRRPRQLDGMRPCPNSNLERDAKWWSTAAALERAAVEAFAELARDLERLGAPKDLVRRARAAQQDEIRHAEMCEAMAGGTAAWPEPPTRNAPSPPDLLSFAMFNASEGCVLEAFAALEVLVQSRRATSPVAQEILAQIAEDEIRHAQLSVEIDSWVRSLLSEPERCEVERNHQQAIAELSRSLSGAVEQGAGARPALGLAGPEDRVELFERFVVGLGSVMPRVA